MARFHHIVTGGVFFVLCLLAFLLLFESYVTIPVWLQPAGRMHPMVLHFPIVLIVLLAALNLFKKKLEPASFETVHAALLHLTVLTTALTALMGFFLSREEGYASGLMTWHKWIGVAGSYALFALLFLNPRKGLYKGILCGSLGLVFVAGHFGAGLTHGEGFIVEPLRRGSQETVTEETPLYEAFVEPILEAKCQGCHNAQKHKGDLDMTTYDRFQRGGEDGPVWTAGHSDESEIIRRAWLPLEHDDHMPPEGKPQLTPEEIALLTRWIEDGADPARAMADLSPADSLYLLAATLLTARNEATTAPRYTFAFADPGLVTSLNTPYRTVIQETPDAPALAVSLYVRHAYQPASLTELLGVREQIVSLNLAYLPIADEDLETIGAFVNLETLNLNFTDVTGATVQRLRACSRLHSLSLSGTRVDARLVESLAPLEALQDVYVWNTALTEEDIRALRRARPDVHFHTGYLPGDDPPIQLSPPLSPHPTRILETGEAIVLEHKLPGVSIRYTTDGSEPDSLASPLYRAPIPFQTLAHVRAIAYKDGWWASDPASFRFFSKGHTPSGVELLHDPNPRYAGNGALSLTDHQQGDATNFSSRSWLGYQDTPFAALVDFGEAPPTLREVVLSYGQNIGAYIMPPVAVEIWGGDDPHALTLLKRVAPPPPTDYEPNEEASVAVSFSEVAYRYYRVVAHPVARLPAWHAGNGDRGWVFVDELFFY